jgi:peptidoglycan/xylan/chitin deacetylase (PgdA/CDA1 family)
VGIHIKRAAKAMTLNAINATPLTGKFLAREMLQKLRIGFEPPTEAVPYPDGANSAACVSIDFDASTPERLVANRIGTYAIVELSEKYGIPLTWAICGVTAEEDMNAYHRLLDSSTRPEIGVHTYSHIDVSHSTAEQLEAEIVRCIGVLGLSSDPETFVFPWNKEGHFDVLKRMGFIAYRGKHRVIGAPSAAKGLWNMRPVYYVDQKSLGAGSLVKRYVDTCIRFDSVFHLWLHPWSIVNDGSSATMVKTMLEPVFAHMAKKRDEGVLSTRTMGEIAKGLGPPKAASS